MRSKSFSSSKIIYILLILTAILLGTTFWISAKLATGLGFILSILAIWKLLDRLENNIKFHQDNIFKQYECKKLLEYKLGTDQPLPYTRRYRGSPDFLLEIYQQIIEEKPHHIVEASSGISTLVCATALKNLGGERTLTSLEHSELYANISANTVKEYALENIAQVKHAPLVTHTINNENWMWYDFSAASIPSEIDMIIVDGPPSRTQKNARYPALALLYKQLKSGGVLLLDDAARKSELETIKKWQVDFPEINVIQLPLEKGMAIIKKP